MATINNSSNEDSILPRPEYTLIVDFDQLKSEEDKKESIKQLEMSHIGFFNTLAKIFSERLKTPPKKIPDKIIFSVDTETLHRAELIRMIDKMRFLLAIKYSTL